MNNLREYQESKNVATGKLLSPINLAQNAVLISFQHNITNINKYTRVIEPSKQIEFLLKS